MKVYIKERDYEDALRIELHITIRYDDGACYVDEKYRSHVEQLVKEGLVEIR